MKKHSTSILLLSLFLSNFLHAQHDVYNHSDWINNYAIVFQYDKNGNNDYKERLEWNSEKEKWDKKSVYTTAYDDDEIPVEYTHSIFNKKTNNYVQKSFQSYEITNLGNATVEYIHHFFNKKTNQLKPHIKSIVEYLDDSLNKEVKQTSYIWTSKEKVWINSYQTTTDYDHNQEPIKILKKQWNKKTNEWQNFSLKEIIHSDNYRKKATISKKWDKEINDWVIENKFEDIFNSKKTALKSQSWYNWDSDKNDWKLVKKNMITQFEKNAEYSISKKLNQETGYWEYVSRNYFYYNELGSIADIVYQKWDFETKSWVNKTRTTYKRNDLDVVEMETYQIAVPLEQTPMDSLSKSLADCVFPNPFHPADVINCTLLDKDENYFFQVVDVNGNIIFEKNRLIDGSFGVSKHLPSGIYFFNLKENQQILFTRKVTVQN